MLKHTFCHLPRISATLENCLWLEGVLTWEEFLDAPKLPLGPKVSDVAKSTLEECLGAYERGDLSYFAPLLKRELWRLFPDYRERAVYFDIETTGLDPASNIVTTVCTYDGTAVTSFVNGENLETFPDHFIGHDLLVSFNGIQFDVPFLNRYFHNSFQRPHLDLRFILGSLGYKGGLKKIERVLALDRKGLSDMDGYGAVLLWNHYQRSGDRRALDTLLAYNALDVLNLELLMVKAYNMKLENTAFPRSLRLEEPEPVETPPFPVSTEMVARVAGTRNW